MKNKTFILQSDQLLRLIAPVLLVIVFAVFFSDEALGQRKDKTPTTGTDTTQVTNLPMQTMTLSLTQDKIFPPAPGAAELGRFSAMQVGLYTGTAQYSIPIYEFKTPNLSVPITLDYSSNGLVVDKIGSWVGFDWSLNVGGVINRYRKGKVDKPGSRPQYPTNWSSMTSVQKANYLDGLLIVDQDLEPDEFVFTFPNHSGKFVFDEMGTLTLLPYSNLKIETNTSGGEYSFFKITTPDGVIFKFESLGYTYPQNESSFISSWYLTQIIHPWGDTITFNYSTINLTQYFGVVQSATTVVASSTVGPPPNCSSSVIEEKVNSINNSVLFLDNINFQGHGSIVFERKSRQDSYFDYRLRKITIRDNSNNPIKHIVFHHQFPLRSTSYQSKTNLGISEPNGEHNKRMFLDSVQVQGSDTTARLSSYAFYYNSLTQLPARYSYAQDHWGYFNGIPNTDFAVKSEVPSNYQSFFSNMIPTNANRNPDYTYAQKGMLQKIVFPTGGYTTIDYEPNKDSSGNNIGGCRVLRTKTYESVSSSPEIKKYLYSSVQSSINYKYYTEYTVDNFNLDCQWESSCTYGVLSSNSYYNLSINGLYHVLYGKVEVQSGENAENGKEVHVFYTDIDAVGTPINGSPIYPLVKSNTGWKTGLLDLNYMTNNGLIEVWKRDPSYNFLESRNGKSINCLAVERVSSPSCLPSTYLILNPYNVVPYTLNSVWYYINQETITKYQSNGNIISTTNYTYDVDSVGHSLLSKESFESSDGRTMEKRYYYPQDYSAVQNFSTLISSRIINVPVDTRTYKGTQLISGEQVKYNNYGQPTDVYRAEIGPGVTDIAFNATNPYTFTAKENIQYNLSKFIKQVTPQDNISTFYLWDSTGKYLMAAIKGGGIIWSQVSGYDGLNCDYNSYTLWTSLNNAVPNAKITTFSYLPLKGLTQSTNQMGVKTNYSYDHSGRLSEVKNDDTKLLKKYKYRYATN